MRKINLNKVFFIFLCSLGIALGCFASAVSLLTKNIPLEVTLLLCTYFLGIMLVRIRRKYKIIKTD